MLTFFIKLASLWLPLDYIKYEEKKIKYERIPKSFVIGENKIGRNPLKVSYI